MKININDPRITQYALGEMTEKEQQAFENEINGNSEILREIEEIKQFSAELDNGFNADPELSLDEPRKQKIEDTAGIQKNKFSNKSVLIKLILTAAAIIVLFLIVRNNLYQKDVEGKDIKSVKKEDEEKEKIRITKNKVNEERELKEKKVVKDNTIPLVPKNKVDIIAAEKTLINEAYLAFGKKDYDLAIIKAKEAQQLSGLPESRKEKIENFIALCEKRIPLEDNGKITIKNRNAPENKAKNYEIEIALKNADTLIKNKLYAHARDQLEKILVRDPYNVQAIEKLKKLYKRMLVVGKARYAMTQEERNAETVWHAVTPLIPRSTEVQWKWCEPVLPRQVGVRTGRALSYGDIAVREGESTTINNEGSKRLSSIVIKQINFNDATIQDAVKYFNAEVKRNASNEKNRIKVQLNIDESELATIPHIDMTLDNIPLSEAIRYLCQICDLKYNFVHNSLTIEKGFNTENYSRIFENPFMNALKNPLSTFSIDVDTASYSNVRRFLNQGQLPPADSVRIEEMINYFDYEYPQPEDGQAFSVNFEMASCPWEPKHRLVKVGLKGREIAEEKRPTSNLVFLLDVSGSMETSNKLPLLKKSMKLLVEKLGEKDRVAIVVYAGSSGLVLPSTTADKKEIILSALDRLRSGGSTNGGAGIQLAYKIATANYIEGGINRVILATDGDFNVGTTDEGSLERLIEKKAKSGVFLSILGFGMGNYKDSNLEKLSGKGNGNYAYIDTLNEAKKVLVNEMGATLITIAKDVKIQVEFNPALVEAYRLIGYENRMLKKEDFNDDKKDAGEIGAGHTVTAFYEIVPKGVKIPTPKVDALKYQQPKKVIKSETEFSDEVMTVKLRYKEPNGKKSKLITFPLKNKFKEYASASDDFKFASSVAAFGMILRNSQYKGNATYGASLELAEDGLINDKFGYKKEFLSLIKKAQRLQSMKSE